MRRCRGLWPSRQASLSRMLGLSTKLSILIASGNSICGNSAIATPHLSAARLVALAVSRLVSVARRQRELAPNAGRPRRD